MSDRITQLRTDFDSELASALIEAEATILRDRWVGRKSGLLTAEMKTLGKLSPEDRKNAGAELNELKNYVEVSD
jgi:phenylalanyl-tRNA synthetase alpha chain